MLSDYPLLRRAKEIVKKANAENILRTGEANVSVERRADVLIRREVYGGETLAKQLTRSSKHNANALLLEDHKKVQKRLKEYQEAKDDVKKKAVVDEVCTDLTVRSQIDRGTLLSRAARGDRCMDIMDEAKVEHTLPKQLVQELKTMQPDDPLYGAKFTVLGEYVAHHIEEEQNEMFKKVKRSIPEESRWRHVNAASRRGGRANNER